MKIVAINLNSLRNKEWFQLMTKVRDLITLFTPRALWIEELFTEFLSGYADADVALEIIRKSTETDKMIEADQLRDSAFQGVSATIHAVIHHYNPAHSEAARQQIIVLNRFGNPAHKAASEETADLCNLIREQHGHYAGFVQTLGLTAWVDELAAHNDACETLVKARNEEVAERPTLHVRDTRHALDATYRQIVERIEALSLIQGPEPFAAFVDRLNAFITRYKNIPARRCGQHKPEPEPNK
jgi:hypothetical protein